MSNSSNARPNWVFCVGIGQWLTLLVRFKNAVAICGQRVRPAVLSQPHAQQVQVRFHRPRPIKLQHQPARRIVDHGDQHQRLAATFEPVVDRCVHLHQLAEATPPRPPSAVWIATPLPLPEALRHQPSPQLFDANLQALGRQLLAGQVRTEVAVTRPIRLEHSPTKRQLAPVIRRLTPKPEDKSPIAVGLLFDLQPPHLPHALLQQPSRLRLHSLSRQNASHDGEHVPRPVTHFEPVPD